MILLEALEKSICPDPNCKDCIGLRELAKVARAKLAELAKLAEKPAEKPANADAAQKPTDAPTPPNLKVFDLQSRLLAHAKNHSQKANALESLATTVPGLSRDAQEGLRMVLNGL